MSVTPSLKAAARSAYRHLWRASSSTFAGDLPTLTAWRAKMRNDARAVEAESDPKAYESKITLAREIADILQKNIAQARKQENSDVWRLRLTEKTELGDNESIKNPPPVQGRRSSRTNAEHAEEPDHDPSQEPKQRRLNYSQLKKAHKNRVTPELREEDLEESFVRGHGPGGQAINKTNNNVQLIHKPTGIRVTCQQTRSLDLNRRYARQILLDKLDQLANPGLSKSEMRQARQNERERRRRKKQKK
ncbi:hypothetical protein PUNSTDRAFT_88482, partial [Punctularia strigosozonata HHB-11173 SS5]|uniref:uncharacterized protein n=1 Tax=Punctularia strigosozonata (strain HHB-11173) TaxID=741275 RepID=UPI0004418565